jgi:alkylation response protein AidB-like acyl-CoA dehydrogenase
MGATVGVSANRTAVLNERFVPLFEQIREAAGRHERERSLPYEEVRLLADAGFGAVRLPLAEGGGGATLAEFFALLVELAAADSNQPQIWRNHIAFVEDRLQPTVEEQNRHWRTLLAEGAVVGGAWSERGNKSFRESSTHVTQGPDGARLTGVKYYSTGSIYADWISVAAKRDEDDLIVMVDARAPGVQLSDDWTGFGQRTTGSGTASFTDVAVDELSVYPFLERAPYQEAVYQLVLLATLAGIGRAAHRDLVQSLQHRQRAYPHGLGDVPREDAQLQTVVGRVSALASSAEASVVRAATQLDVAAAAALAEVGEQERTQEVNRAAIAVYEAQLTITSDVLEATTLLFDGLGSSAVDESAQLDRHWRNARTVTSHNPRIYKERIVGDWYLNGTAPSIFGSPSGDTEKQDEKKDAVSSS